MARGTELAPESSEMTVKGRGFQDWITKPTFSIGPAFWLHLFDTKYYLSFLWAEGKKTMKVDAPMTVIVFTSLIAVL